MKTEYKTKEEIKDELIRIKKQNQFIRFDGVTCAIKKCKEALLLNKAFNSKFAKIPNGPDGKYYLCNTCYNLIRKNNNKRNVIFYNKVKKNKKVYKNNLQRGNDNRKKRNLILRQTSQELLNNLGYDNNLFKQQREQAGRYLFIDLLDKHNIISRNEHIIRISPNNKHNSCADLYIPCLNIFIEFKNTYASSNKSSRQFKKYKKWIKEINKDAKLISVDLVDSINTDFDYLNFHIYIKEELNKLFKQNKLSHVNIKNCLKDFNKRIKLIKQNLELIYSSSLSIKNKTKIT